MQYVSNLQSYNRYSYVHNNPLSYTDPSGFGILNKIKKAFRSTHYYKHFDKVRDFVKGNKYAQMAIQIGAAYFGGPIGAALASAALTRLNGGNLGDMVRAGIMGGISGAIGGMDMGIGRIVVSAAFGGISAAMSGGDFVAGFAMAGFTAGLAPGLKGVSGFAVSTIVAGTASVMGGGKFANGAKSAAFGYMVGSAIGVYGEYQEYMQGPPIEVEIPLSNNIGPFLGPAITATVTVARTFGTFAVGKLAQWRALHAAKGMAKFNPKRSGHIFRNAENHVNPVTHASKGRYSRLFENVTTSGNKNMNVLRGPQRNDPNFIGYTQKFRNGKYGFRLEIKKLSMRELKGDE